MTGYISERDYNNEFLSFLRKENGLKYFNIFSNMYETAPNDPIENLFNKRRWKMEKDEFIINKFKSNKR